MKQDKKYITPSGFLKTMSFLHLGIAATPIIMGVLFYSQADNILLDFSGSGDMFLAIVPLIALSSIVMGNFIFKKIMGKVPKELGLKEKLAKFQTVSIIKYALLEGAALFSMVIFSNTQNLAYIIIGAFLVLFLFLQKPTKNKIEHVLGLTGEQKAQFNKLDMPLG
ncbi:hypothetical protein [Flagellimonas baculiformis]|uniref:hypothetical protein n=1 Tax=Flagellimonas baculiformis TaxID=3067310 RepID=UPI00296F36DA|nr:hypothetical protein [Muricauda sp. D6]